MSSSFLNRLGAAFCRASFGFAVAGVLGSFGPALAAEVYLQPEGEVLFDVDSNRALLLTGDKTVSEGYGAQAGAVLGVATPVSDTTVKAQVGYQAYPKDDDHEFQGTAELASNYRWERSTFNVYGQFDRLNTFSSELASPIFDPIVPQSPTTPETGRITTDTTRTLVNLVPKYDYKLTERLSVGVSGVIESTDYSGAFASDYSSYTYGQGSVYASYALTPRMDLTVGPYITRDVARTGSASTTGTGGNVSLNFKWSKTFTGRLDLSGESDQVTLGQAGIGQVSATAYGATYTSTWTGQISQLQLSVGRQLTPSGAGGEYFADQLQVEFDRSLSPRLTTVTAARLIRYSPSVDVGASASYKYVDATVGLKWLATRTWHIDGGLEFLRVDYGSAFGAQTAGAANNFRLFLGFGYTGLGSRTLPTYPAYR